MKKQSDFNITIIISRGSPKPPWGGVAALLLCLVILLTLDCPDTLVSHFLGAAQILV